MVSARPSLPHMVTTALPRAACGTALFSWTLLEPLTSVPGAHLTLEASAISRTQAHHTQVIGDSKIQEGKSPSKVDTVICDPTQKGTKKNCLET